MIYHGLEIFDREKMEGYDKFLTNDIKMGNAVLMSYLGKTCELIAGVLLVLGLFTRAASVLMAITMSVISFRIGQGRVYMEEQHPFMFVLFAFIFFVDGGQKWSLDNVIFKRKRRQ